MDPECAAYVKEHLEPILDKLTPRLLMERPQDPQFFLLSWFAEEAQITEKELRAELHDLRLQVAQLEAETANSGSSRRPSHPDAHYNVERLPFGGHIHLFNLNLYDGAGMKENLRDYYRMCVDHDHLQVTTSCFATWMQNKRTSGCGKVIPAVPFADDSSNLRVFFFDDNNEFGGLEKSPGICNLRDVRTGEFVEYGEGLNGFHRLLNFDHTVVHISDQFRNVIVKVSILDAMSSSDYFISLLTKYSKPGEQLLVFMDVNSTIMCNDSVQGKGTAESLRSVIFELLEHMPHEKWELKWQNYAPVKIEKKRTLKQLVKDIHQDDLPALHRFWTQEACEKLFLMAESNGKLQWSHTGAGINLEMFRLDYNRYLQCIGSVTTEGLVNSWFKVHEYVKGSEHKLILNSFGIDARRVLQATHTDERSVLQVVVNFEKWSDKDAKQFRSNYES